MKVVLAGAFGNLGIEILKALMKHNLEVVALDLKEIKIDELGGRYTFKCIDVTNPKTLEGVCDGADVLISTIGLTGASTRFNNYDIDYQGNLYLIREAKKANVKKIHYISVIKCDDKDARKIPMLHAKFMLENELKQLGIDYVIYRPTGYFYDIGKVFKPYIEQGEMNLLKGYQNIKCNVVDCPDFADFIVNHLNDTNRVYEIGGKETYSYFELTRMCFAAYGKEMKIKYVPKWLFGVLARLPKVKKAGKHDIILFSQFTLSHDLVGKDIIGEASFKEYIYQYFKGVK